MGLTWFELEVGYPSSPKAKALQVRLKNPTADAYPMRLWAYCYLNEVFRFDGVAAESTIEDACAWRGKHGALVAALLDCRILDRDGDALVAHGVEERLAAAQGRRGAAAERQRRWRDRQRDVTDHGDGDVTRDVTRESPVTSRSYQPTNQPTDQPSSLRSPAAGGRAGGNGVPVLGPLGSGVRASVAKGLRHGLKPPASQPDADEFEARIRGLGGVDQAVEYLAATCRTRDTEPQGVGLLLEWLRDLGPMPEEVSA
jgi:hypothetical protein